MTDLERDIRAAILRALNAAKGPMPESALKQHLRNLFSHVAFSDGDLKDHIARCDDDCLIAGTNDVMAGMMWDLTPKRKKSASSKCAE